MRLVCFKLPVDPAKVEVMSEKKGKYDVEILKRENAVLRKYAAMQAAAEETVGCQTIYVDIAGGLEDGFVLDELIFFTLPRPETGRSGLRVWKDGVLWMAVSRTEWWDRKRLTPKQADGAIKRLVKKELVFKEMFLFNKQKTTHLRLNVPEFFKRYTEILEDRNPPEDEGDTMLKDIQDLYEMLGIPKGNTPQVEPPQKEQGIPEGNKVSPNGDSINIPHASSTHPSRKERGAKPSAPRANDFPSNVLYREVTERYPSKANWHDILKFIDSVSQRLGRPATKDDLAPFYSAWCGMGWNSNSINWLEYAVKGVLPGKGKPNANYQPSEDYTPAERELAAQIRASRGLS
jgi:hypothetical protein